MEQRGTSLWFVRITDSRWGTRSLFWGCLFLLKHAVVVLRRGKVAPEPWIMNESSEQAAWNIYPRPTHLPSFPQWFPWYVSPCSCAGATHLGILSTDYFCFTLSQTSAEPSWNHPKTSLNRRPFHTSYQFQPCLLDGEYLSMRAVSLSSESFCSRRNWETDWCSTPGLVGREGRLCSLDQCSCWLTRLETQAHKIMLELTAETGTNYAPQFTHTFFETLLKILSYWITATCSDLYMPQ